jgi:hypothetical protein
MGTGWWCRHVLRAPLWDVGWAMFVHSFASRIVREVVSWAEKFWMTVVSMPSLGAGSYRLHRVEKDNRSRKNHGIMCTANIR